MVKDASSYYLNNDPIKSKKWVLVKDPCGSKVLERYVFESYSEVKAGKEQSDHEMIIWDFPLHGLVTTAFNSYWGSQKKNQKQPIMWNQIAFDPDAVEKLVVDFTSVALMSSSADHWLWCTLPISRWSKAVSHLVASSSFCHGTRSRFLAHQPSANFRLHKCSTLCKTLQSWKNIVWPRSLFNYTSTIGPCKR